MYLYVEPYSFPTGTEYVVMCSNEDTETPDEYSYAIQYFDTEIQAQSYIDKLNPVPTF